MVRAAALFDQPGNLRVVDIDVDAPGDHEVVVRTSACGLCHSDLHAMNGDVPAPGPSVLGHEAAGVVEAVGVAVTTVAPGDHVVGCFTRACGTCPPCGRGETWLCQLRDKPPLARADDAPSRLSMEGRPVGQFLGVGGFADTLLLHESGVVRIPKALPLDTASLLGCGVLTGYGTVVNRARVRPGESVVVVGCGGVGLSAIQTAAIVGASPIIAIDIHDHALDLARQLGATVTINSSDEGAVKLVRTLTQEGADHVIEAIGFPGTMQEAIEMVRPAGTAYLIGIAPIPAMLELSAFKLVWFNRGVQGVFMGANNFRRDIPALANLALAGKFDLDHLLTERLALDDIGAGFDTMRSGSLGRSVVVF